MKNAGLKLYLLFTISWFLHLPERIPFLGTIRFDFILILSLFALTLLNKQAKDKVSFRTQTDTLLSVLTIYIILTIPLVEWPGSVINTGIPRWIKAIIFYYFTISFIKTKRDLTIFISIFLTCQSWRILEPLYLHITEGYWGSKAMMVNWEFLNRLSGAPYDIVNPNGLAFVICTVFPFLYFLRSLSSVNWIVFVSLTPLFLYTLALTSSRTGIIGLLVIIIGILIKSKRRVLIASSLTFITIVSFPLLNPDTQDRYLSIFGKGEKNAVTAEGRWEGIKGDFEVVLHRPIFGHGLGTSQEANWNVRGHDQISHNLYTEVGQELGFLGVIIFLLFIKSIFVGFSRTNKILYEQNSEPFLQKLIDAMQVWLAMNFIFSFASYGLSSYEWYLFAGLSSVMLRLVCIESLAENSNTKKNKSIDDIVVCTDEVSSKV